MRCAVVVLLAACGRIGFDPLAAADARFSDGSPDAAPFGGFANPVTLTTVGGSDPQLSDDGLELWVASPSPTYELQFARRTTTTVDFSPLIVDAGLSSAQVDVEPALSANGLVLVFISERLGIRRVYEATRSDRSQPFGAPTLADGLQGVNVISLDLAGSGNALVIDTSAAGLERWTRPGFGQPFGNPQPVPSDLVLQYPTLTPDELLLFGNVPGGASGAAWAKRSSVAEPFVGQGELLVDGCAPGQASDPDITADGRHLIVRCPELRVYSR